MENQTIEEINTHIFNVFIKKGLSPMPFLQSVIHKLYYANNFKDIEQLVNTYGYIRTDVIHHAALISIKNLLTLLKIYKDYLHEVFTHQDSAGDILLHKLCYKLVPNIIETENIPVHNIKNNEGLTPTLLSICEGNNDKTRYLLSQLPHETVLEMKDLKENNILHLAYLYDNKEMIIFIENLYPSLQVLHNALGMFPKDYYKYVHNISIPTREIDAPTCCVCEDTLINPCTLTCHHKYCYDCLYHVNYTNSENIKCKYRCNIESVSIHNVVLDKIRVIPSENRLSIFYLKKFYMMARNVCSQMDDTLFINRDGFFYNKGGIEVVCTYKKSCVRLESKLVQFLPRDTTQRLKLLRCIMELNKPSGLVNVGTIFVDLASSTLMTALCIHMDYLKFNALIDILNRFITIICTISATLPSIGSLTQALDIGNYSFKPKINISSLVSLFVNINGEDLVKVSHNTVKMKNGILIRVGKDCHHIELEKFIGVMKLDHLLSLEYLSSYKPVTDIDNFRISVDSITGIVLAHSILLLNTCRDSYMVDVLDMFTKESSILLNTFNVNVVTKS